jgi:hypothetical protein
MKNILLSLVLFLIFNGIAFSQPMSGDYTVGLSLFKAASGMDISFEKRVRAITIEDLSHESYLRAESGDSDSDDLVYITREINQEYYVPVLNGREYHGSLYHEFSSTDNMGLFEGARGVYSTIGAAALDINSRGVSGPVRLLLVDASYPSETFPIVFGTISGASSVNTITILPAAGVITDVSGSIAQPLFDLSACSFFIFDGRQNGTGSISSFSISNNSSSSSSGNIRFINGSSDNIVKYMNLSGISSTSTTRLIEFGTSTAPGGNSNNMITHCDLNSTRYGIYCSGTTGNYNSNNVISYNKIYNTTFSHFFFSSNSSSTTIEHNEIYHKFPPSPATNNSAIQVNASNYGTNNIRFNKFYDLQTTTFLMRGIYLIGAGAESVWNIENNFISLTADNGTKTTLDAISLAGANAYTVNLYYNTVRIGGSNTGGTAGNVVASGLFKNTNSADAVLNMKNNIFHNTRKAGTAGVIYAGINLNNLAGTMNIDYNDYYSASVNVRMAGADYTDITLYKAAAAPNDQNTIFKDVNFVSNNDLHIAGASNGDVDLAGTPIAGIETDIDGDTRSTNYPYMGADEASIPIPVELTSFTAAAVGNKVILKWSTASETNNYGFEIHRASVNGDDSRDWINAGFVKGNGTTSEDQNYSFEDKNLSSGSYVYRLKQVDMDGSYSFTNEINIAVTTPSEYSLYQNYPNPFNPVTKIEFTLPFDSRVTLSVFNILGQEISRFTKNEMQSGLHEYTFDGTLLTSGIYFYFLEAEGSNGSRFSTIRKMILLK